MLPLRRTDRRRACVRAEPTLIRPDEGAWTSADNLTGDGKGREDRDARKYVMLNCPDGGLLLAFSGMAELRPRGLVMSDYIRTTLRGENRTVEGHLLFLKERLDRDVGRGSYWRTPLVITGTAFQLANRRRLPDGSHGPNERTFNIQAWRVDQPMFFAHGGGAFMLPRADRGRAERALHQRPRRTEDYLGLLAAITANVARIKGSGVSFSCQTVYMKPSGYFQKSRDFREGLPELDMETRPVPFLTRASTPPRSQWCWPANCG